MDTPLTLAANAGAGADAVLHLTIAGIAVTLDMQRIDPATRQRLAARYEGFTARLALPESLSVRLWVEPGAPYIDPPPLGTRAFAEPSLASLPRPYEVRVAVRGQALEFASYLEQGGMDFAAGRGWLTMRPGGSPENFLRVLYSRLCVSRGGVLLHASGVVRAGKGYVFFGPSGAGKTTLARLSKERGAMVLSDDIVILRRDGARDRVRDGACDRACDEARIGLYGAPFHGTSDPPEMTRVNESATLCGVFAPVKATQLALLPMGVSDAVARLVGCVPYLGRDPASASEVLCFCRELARDVPAYFLHFRMDSDFWRMLDGLELNTDRLPGAA